MSPTAKKTPSTSRVKVSAAARAKSRAAKVVAEAGTDGHIVTDVPHRPYRTDIVDPVLSFVVYGVPSPQGSKVFAGYRGGKPVLKEQSAGVDPWRTAVRGMGRKAIRDWAQRTGRQWVALDEPVMVSAVVTMPPTEAATKRGDVYAYGTPDLDKLERAIGDALSPTPLSPSVGKGLTPQMRQQVREKAMAQHRANSVLHDDSRIVVWDHVCKVYPGATVDALGYAGVTIRVWRMADLQAAEKAPVIHRDGARWMRAADLRAWARPHDGTTWDEAARRLWGDPQAVLEATGPVTLQGRAIDDAGMRTALGCLAVQGPEGLVEVRQAQRQR